MKSSKLTKIVLATLLTSSFYTTSVMGASADEFKTDEYYAFDKTVEGSVSGLDLINAASAYEQGYTGAGVIVDVCDGGAVNFKHPDFSNKNDSNIANGNTNLEHHPTIVAGIISAEKNEQGMHGIAYNSNIISSDMHAKDFFKEALANDDIKIINNSWASTPPLDYIRTDEDMKLFADKIEEDIEIAINKNKLLVFSSSNDGSIGPAVPAGIDFFGEEFCHNVISVGALKSSSIKKNESKDSYEFIAKNADGSYKYSTDAIAVFSSLHTFNEDNGLMAPGYNIYSTNKNFKNEDKWVYDNGTSMSAPVVTGVAALVQEAHPYLTGKQIGDVLLSTANKNIGLGETNYFVTFNNSMEEIPVVDTFRVFYFDDNFKDEYDLKSDILAYYKANPESLESIVNIEDGTIEEWLNAGNYDVTYFNNVHQSLYLGQGIVNAGEAVKGLGAINVHRLESKDATTNYSLDGNTKYAYYNVDTKGFDAEWSNDISEIRAGYIATNPLDKDAKDDSGLDFNGKDADLKDLHDRYLFYSNKHNKEYNPTMFNQYVTDFNDRVEASGLAGLHAGFIKNGSGMLTLSGQNTYKGSTVVTAGVLNITGSVTGDVWSTETDDNIGLLTGSGVVIGNMVNNGMVLSGDYRYYTDASKDNVKDGSLIVGGNLQGEGILLVDAERTDSNLIVRGTADLSNMDILAANFIDLGNMDNIKVLTAKEVKLSETDLQFNGEEVLPEKKDLSSFMDYTLKVEASDYNLNNTNDVSLLQTEDDTYYDAIMSIELVNNLGVDDELFDFVEELYEIATLDGDVDPKVVEYFERFLTMQDAAAERTFAMVENPIFADMVHEALRNPSIRKAVNDRMLGRSVNDSENGKWWASMGKNWHRFGVTKAHNYSLATGLDFINNDKAYAGTLLSYGETNMNNSGAHGEYKEYGAALYAGTKNKPGTFTGYLSFARQNNEVKRNFVNLNTIGESDYHSYVFGAGLNYAYDLQYGKDTKWHISPYVAVDYAHYDGKAFEENGAVLFDMETSGISENYADATLGMNFKRKDADATYILGTAYRHVLTGNDAKAKMQFYTFEDDYTFTSSREGRNAFVVNAFVDKKIGGNWSASAGLEKAWAKGGSNLSASVELKYSF